MSFGNCSQCNPPTPSPPKMCDKIQLTKDGLLRCMKPEGHDGKHVMALADLVARCDQYLADAEKHPTIYDRGDRALVLKTRAARDV